jgi:hypothetical protein
MMDDVDAKVVSRVWIYVDAHVMEDWIDVVIAKEMKMSMGSVDEDRPLIFHIEHHLRGISCQQICAAYLETIGPLITGHNLIMAVSRPKNI